MQLVYTLRLYEPALSDTFLVTRFIMGHKAELQATVELQIPSYVQSAVMLAAVQEGLLLRQKFVRANYQKTSFHQIWKSACVGPWEVMEGKTVEGISVC